ncbi:MAG: hypothetical protein ACHQ49_14785, partial [Elusimicrobiota bacterium]
MSNIDSELSPEALAKIASRVGTAAAAILALTALMSSYTVISPGNTGVIFNNLTGSLSTVGQG